ncbi:MAG: hypothetical protein QM610_02010 [Chitinophagaceae bacterium]
MKKNNQAKMIKVLVCLVVVSVMCSFIEPGEGKYGKCNGKNENPCVITDADGTVHNYTGAYLSN